MSTRHKKGSRKETLRRPAELHDAPQHVHSVAVLQGKQDHLTGPELSQGAADMPQVLHGRTLAAAAGHGLVTFGHNEIAALAYELWQARGCPDGSPEEDWFHAAEQLRSKTQNR